MNTNNNKKVRLLHKELSYKIVGSFYKVYNTLGSGHKEDIFQKALGIEFDKIELRYIAKKKISIEYEGKRIGVYEPDFIIEDKIIVKIKSVLSIPRVFEKQLYYYLKSSDYRLGYLVNFGADKTGIRRRIN